LVNLQGLLKRQFFTSLLANWKSLPKVPMAEHNETGKKGEELAAEFLLKKGYHILETNWRFKRAEVDIITKDEAENIVIFVEVKTRTSDFFGTPDSFVTEKKERLLVDLAQAYCEKINHDWEIRFDIISVLIQGKKISIDHIEDAFFPSDI
jgi:putative endonuclease